MKNLMKNKKGFVQFIWAGAALVAAGAWLMSYLKPKPEPTGFAGILSAIPIWGWIAIVLILLIFWRSR